MSGVDYLESSALVKLLLAEVEHEDLREFLAGRDRFATSLLSFTEVTRTVRRIHPDDDEAIAAIFDRIAILELDRRLMERAARLGPRTLRTLDAIHLASAMELAPELRTFVTYDHRLADAARDAGLAVASPGAAAG